MLCESSLGQIPVVNKMQHLGVGVTDLLIWDTSIVHPDNAEIPRLLAGTLSKALSIAQLANKADIVRPQGSHLSLMVLDDFGRTS